MKTGRENIIYIAGPMTGYDDYNYPAFHKAAAQWRNVAWTVLNPAESFDGDQTLPYQTYMRNAIELVMAAGAIALLPGWEKSKGACMEALLAARQGYEFFDAITGESIPIPEIHANPIPVHSAG